MARGDLERAVTRLVAEILGATFEETPGWLQRPAREECGQHWALVCSIYEQLTGLELPEAMPAGETRRLDAVLRIGGRSRVLEIDEKQHFNHYRELTLREYPSDVRVAFPVATWREACSSKKRLEGGGFGKPKPPLFPGESGRHRQRAFRDALTDLLPLEHDFEPTLRIAYFEVEPWIYRDGAEDKLQVLLTERL